MSELDVQFKQTLKLLYYTNVTVIGYFFVSFDITMLIKLTHAFHSLNQRNILFIHYIDFNLLFFFAFFHLFILGKHLCDPIES